MEDNIVSKYTPIYEACNKMIRYVRCFQKNREREKER